MDALLDDKAAPLYGRLTAQRSLDHWDFEDLLAVFAAHGISNPYQWLTLWCFFEGVPKFYRDAYEQGLFSVASEDNFQSELLRRMFLMSSSPLAEEADTWFLREIRGRGVSVLNYLAQHPGSTNGELKNAIADKDNATLGVYLTTLANSFRMIDKQLPVFSDSNSRNARYYITDNFL